MRSVFFSFLTIGWLSTSAFSQGFLNEFPSLCAEASDNQALPGHIIRVGFLGMTSQGMAFAFPDRYSNALQRVLLIENVGLIGQNPYENYSEMILTRTPRDNFVVAQIFVGDQNMEPVVTCVSEVRPLYQFRPDYFGPDFGWLTVDSFGGWLRERRSYRWNWRRWHSQFAPIREDFYRFKRVGYRRDYIKHRRHDRWDRDDRWGRRDGDKWDRRDRRDGDRWDRRDRRDGDRWNRRDRDRFDRDHDRKDRKDWGQRDRQDHDSKDSRWSRTKDRSQDRMGHNKSADRMTMDRGQRTIPATDRRGWQAGTGTSVRLGADKMDRRVGQSGFQRSNMPSSPSALTRKEGTNIGQEKKSLPGRQQGQRSQKPRPQNLNSPNMAPAGNQDR